MTRTASIDTRAIAVLVAGACAIAFAPVFVRLTDAGPAAAGFWRLFLALPALAPIALAGAPQGARSLGRPSRLSLLAGLFFALDLGVWHYGIKFTTVANATILANLSPVVVTAGAWLLLGERPGRLFIGGLLLALLGTWGLAESRHGSAGLNPPLGDALSLSTALWYACYMLTVRRARADEPAGRVMFWSSAAGAPLLLITAFLLGEHVLPSSAGGWLACAGLGMVHVTGQGAIAWALGRVPAAAASVIILAQPVLAAALGWILFSEPLTALQIGGGVLALTGVVLAQAAASRRA